MGTIAVLFPGIGYHCDKPLLYYARKILSEYEIEEIISLKYVYAGRDIFHNKSKIEQAVNDLYIQTQHQLSTVNWNQYDKVIFVSKSIGTAIAVRYEKEKNLVCKNVYFTPLEITFINGMQKGIAFCGTDDPWINLGKIENLCKMYKIDLMVYEGANHSLETKSTSSNLEIIMDVLDKVILYLK